MWRLLALLPFVISIGLDHVTQSWFFSAGWGVPLMPILGMASLSISVVLGGVSDKRRSMPARRSIMLVRLTLVVTTLICLAPQIVAIAGVFPSIPTSVTVVGVLAYVNLELLAMHNAREESLAIASAAGAVALSYLVSLEQSDMQFWLWRTFPAWLTLTLHSTTWLFVAACICYLWVSTTSTRRGCAIVILVTLGIGLSALAPSLLFVPFTSARSALAVMVLVPYMAAVVIAKPLVSHLIVGKCGTEMGDR
jgi:hypothetical protein